MSALPWVVAGLLWLVACVVAHLWLAERGRRQAAERLVAAVAAPPTPPAPTEAIKIAPRPSPEESARIVLQRMQTDALEAVEADLDGFTARYAQIPEVANSGLDRDQIRQHARMLLRRARGVA